MLLQVGLKGSFADSSSKEDSTLIEEIKEQKRSYRNNFAEMQKCRDVLAQSRSYLEVIKNDLVTARSIIGEGRAQTARSRFSSTTPSGMRLVLHPSLYLIFESLPIIVSLLFTDLQGLDQSLTLSADLTRTRTSGKESISTLRRRESQHVILMA
jgi:hypothetical protein